MYHRLFCFPFLSCPRDISSSAIKNKFSSFLKEALQPRDVGAVFLLSIIFVSFSVFLPLPCLTPVPGSDFTCFLGGNNLPILCFLWSSMDRHFRPFICLCTDVDIPGCFSRCHSYPEGCSQAGCGFVTIWKFFNGIAQTAYITSHFPSPSLLCF